MSRAEREVNHPVVYGRKAVEKEKGHSGKKETVHNTARDYIRQLNAQYSKTGRPAEVVFALTTTHLPDWYEFTSMAT
jgi:hypothetical protein